MHQFDKEKFDRDGYLVINDFFTEEECLKMVEKASFLLKTFDLTNHPKTRFSTTEDQSHSDDYFITSSDKISFFFEEDSFDINGNLVVEKEKAINKIGHGLHLKDPLFASITGKEEITNLLKEIGFLSPIILQSMLIFKQPRIGGKVMPHQDSTFLSTTPESAIGFWFPLEDATEENGCLHFIPGSHKTVPVTRKFVRNPAYFSKDSSTPSSEKALYFRYTNNTDPSSNISENDPRFVPVPVKKGSCVLIHGSVVHKSNNNTSDKSRFAFAFHCVESMNCEYSDENWLQIPKEADGSGGFKVVY